MKTNIINLPDANTFPAAEKPDTFYFVDTGHYIIAHFKTLCVHSTTAGRRFKRLLLKAVEKHSCYSAIEKAGRLVQQTFDGEYFVCRLCAGYGEYYSYDVEVKGIKNQYEKMGSGYALDNLQQDYEQGKITLETYERIKEGMKGWSSSKLSDKKTLISKYLDAPNYNSALLILHLSEVNNHVDYAEYNELLELITSSIWVLSTEGFIKAHEGVCFAYDNGYIGVRIFRKIQSVFDDYLDAAFSAGFLDELESCMMGDKHIHKTTLNYLLNKTSTLYDSWKGVSDNENF